MSYDLFETEEFGKSLKRLAKEHAAFLRRKLDGYVYPQLRDEPHFGPNIRKLSGYHPDTWRYRIGRFRIFYLVDEEEKTVFLLIADDRKRAYR